MSTPTNMPCPLWCAEPVGHMFVDRGDGTLQRRHRGAIDTMPAGVPDRGGKATVYVQSYERLNGEGDVTTSPTRVVLQVGDELTSGQVERLVAALTRAAEIAD